MTTATVYDHRICTLGEGVLWHPLRQQLFWFDIIGKQLLSQTPQGEALSWQFDEHVSAAGWVDKDQLIIASETALILFNLENSHSEKLCDLEADNPITRSNDGRADPWGGFWVGTMGKNAETNAGAIYRYYQGELHRLISPVTIPNAICFAPDKRYVYFTDTVHDMIMRQTLNADDGWPEGDPEPFIFCGAEGVHPDGAITDAEGNLWNAQWGASRVACYSPEGELLLTIPLSAEQISCPAFGGPELKTLFATSATQNLSAKDLQPQPNAGRVFMAEINAQGREEPPVILI